MGVPFVSLVGSLALLQFSGNVAGLGHAHFARTLSSIFEFPPNDYRPKFRYWLPDASVAPDVIRYDIDSIAEVGGGGLEFVPYYMYGLPGGTQTPTDWVKYGFGSPAFKNHLKVALGHAGVHDLVLDISQGASQGQGVPSVPRTTGLALELIYGQTDIQSGGTFDGHLPAPVDGELLSGFMHDQEKFGDPVLKAVLAGQVKSVSKLVGSSNNSASPTEIILKEESIVDLTSQVNNGYLRWEAPAGYNETWKIIAFYEDYTNQRSCAPGVGAKDIISNGSWVVDHFNPDGAERITDFWEKNLIDTEEMKGLVFSYGGYFWEDSMEIQATLFWTANFLERFEAQRGYSLVKYLPLLFDISNQWHSQLAPYNETWVYGSRNSKIRDEVLRDYRTTLTEGYQEYLSHFLEWAHSHGFKYSAQTAYNIPLDMSAAVPLPDAPETESLGFRTIDSMRQFSGSALLKGNLNVSTEVGTIGNPSYTQTVPELLNLFKQAFAGSVSQMVIHGFTYSGEYPQTGWPGYNGFGFLHTEMWNDKVPTWAQIDEAFEFASRNSLVLRTGRHQSDIALFNYAAPYVPAGRSLPASLRKLGFSYDFLGPENLASNATAQDGILAPSGPSYKALIFSNETTVPEYMLHTLEAYAASGLPIFFIGQLPSDCFERNDCPTEGVGSFLKSFINRYENVQTVPHLSDIPTTLENSGVNPRISFDRDLEALYSVWRKLDSAGEDYIYFYNEGPTVKVNVKFEAVVGSAPYILDAWTGGISPVLHYNQTSEGIILPMTLQTNQSRIYMLSSRETTQLHVLSSTDGVKGISASGNGELEARVTDPANLFLSDGRTITSNCSELSPSNIPLWDLSVKSYIPAGPNTTETDFEQINHTNLGLRPWSQITDLRTVSGVGEYNSTFAFSHNPEEIGAFISFGPIKDTLRAWVNEQKIPPIDMTDPQADITPFIKQGVNTIRVVVTSTLFNAVKSRANTTISVGKSAAESNPFYEEAPWAEFGLIGPVEVQPVERIYID